MLTQTFRQFRQFPTPVMNQGAQIVADTRRDSLPSHPSANGSVSNTKRLGKLCLPLRPVERNANVNEQVAVHSRRPFVSAVVFGNIPASLNQNLVGGDARGEVIVCVPNRAPIARHTPVANVAPNGNGGSVGVLDDAQIAHRSNPSQVGLIATTAPHEEAQGKESDKPATHAARQRMMHNGGWIKVRREQNALAAVVGLENPTTSTVGMAIVAGVLKSGESAESGHIRSPTQNQQAQCLADVRYIGRNNLTRNTYFQWAA